MLLIFVFFLFVLCSKAVRSLELAVDKISLIVTALNEPGIKSVNVSQ